jgi:hypothetical protein
MDLRDKRFEGGDRFIPDLVEKRDSVNRVRTLQVQRTAGDFLDYPKYCQRFKRGPVSLR